MRKKLIAAIAALTLSPVAAGAECPQPQCNNLFLGADTCTYTQSGWSPSCSSSPTLTITRHWKQITAGHFTLEETPLTISFLPADKKYHLFWDAQDVDAFDALYDTERKGVKRMQDFYAAGSPAK